MDHAHNYSGTTVNALGKILSAGSDRNGNNFRIVRRYAEYNQANNGALPVSNISVVNVGVTTGNTSNKMYAPTGDTDTTGLQYNLTHLHTYSGITDKFKGFTTRVAPTFTGTKGTTDSATQDGTVSSSFTGSQQTVSATQNGSVSSTFTGTGGTTGSTTQDGTVSSSFTGNSGNTGRVGSGSSISIMPPYVVKYCWERTA